MRRLTALIALLMLAAAVGCGGSDDDSDAPPGKTVTAKVYDEEQKGIPADLGQWMVEIGVYPGDDLAFTVAKVIAPSGNTNFRLTNPQEVGHNLTLEEVGAGSVRTRIIRNGESAWKRISLLRGSRYIFYCSVPGHREAGMEGKIEIDLQLEGKDLKQFRG